MTQKYALLQKARLCRTSNRDSELWLIHGHKPVFPSLGQGMMFHVCNAWSGVEYTSNIFNDHSSLNLPLLSVQKGTIVWSCLICVACLHWEELFEGWMKVSHPLCLQARVLHILFAWPARPSPSQLLNLWMSCCKPSTLSISTTETRQINHPSSWMTYQILTTFRHSLKWPNLGYAIDQNVSSDTAADLFSAWAHTLKVSVSWRTTSLPYLLTGTSEVHPDVFAGYETAINVSSWL